MCVCTRACSEDNFRPEIDYFRPRDLGIGRRRARVFSFFFLQRATAFSSKTSRAWFVSTLRADAMERDDPKRCANAGATDFPLSLLRYTFTNTNLRIQNGRGNANDPSGASCEMNYHLLPRR